MCACEIPPGNDATYCNPDQPATVSTAAEYVDGLEDLTRAKKEDFSPERKRTGTTGPLPVITIDGASNDRPTSGAGGPAGKAVDLAMCEAAADAIDKACNQGWGGMGTNKEAIFEILKDKTLAERQKIDEFFRTKYGKNYGKAKNGSDWGLEEEIKDELDGADRKKALDLLIRKDGSADRAGHIHEVLMEKDQWFEGRSKEMCEKDLRDTLATMNSDQLAQLDNEYRTRHGKGLFDTLKDDPKLSEPTKQALAIYAQGADKLKLNTADQLKLADIAIKAKNIEMFQEAVRDASPEARKPFTGDSGEETLKKAFGQSGRVNGKTVYEETTELQHARDYVKNGRLSTATLIGENNSWAGDNERAIEKALHDLKPEERRDYARGRWLASNISDESKLGESDRRALASYREIHAALEKAGNSVELARWEDMIARKDGSLVAKLAGHRGSIYDDSLGDVLSDIEGMSRKDWDRLRVDKNYREEIEGCLKTYLSDSDVKKCMDLIDQKKNARPLDEAVIKTMSGMKPEERESFIRGRELFERKAEMSTLSLVDQTALLSYTKIHIDLSFAAATSEGRRGVLDAIDDASGTFDDTEENVYDAIKNMSHEEQSKYRHDALFKSKVDEMVRDVLDEGPEQNAAFRMLKQIENQQSPSEDLVVKILQPAGKGDDAAVVRAVLKAFRDSENKGEKPSLFERINNPDPKNLADRALADDFKDALRKTLDAKYADKLIQNGFLSVKEQMEFCKNVTGDDEQNAYGDLAALGAIANKYPRSPAEAEADAHAKARDEGKEKADPAAVEAARARAKEEIDAFELRVKSGDTAASIIKDAHDEAQKLLTNQQYQDDVLHFLSPEERQVALNATKQGEMRTEDKIRSHMLGAGTGEDQIKQELSRLSPVEKEQLRRDFAGKYKADLTYEFIDELGGQDKTEALRSARREAATAEEAFDRSRAEYYESRDGFGGTWVNEMWDDTGYQADEAMSVYRSAMTEFAAKFEQLPPEKQQEFMQNLQQSLEMFVESKGALGDGLTDAGIAAGCVVAGFVTKGSTWVLLGALISGGFFKAGVKGAIMGSDYDWGSSAALVDFGAGGVDAALNLVTFGAGSSAAKGVLATGGKELLKKGSEEALEKGLIKIVKESVKSSSKEISEEAVEKLVQQLAREEATEAERALLRKSITENLDKAVKEEADHFLKKVGRDILHGTKPGIAGGFGSGGFRVLAQWDDTKSFEENMVMVGKMAATSAAIGAAGAIATTMVFSVGTKGYHALKERYDLKPGQPPSPAQLKEMEQAIARDAGGAEVTVHTDANGDIVAIVRSNRRPVDALDLKPGDRIKLDGETWSVAGHHENGRDLILTRGAERVTNLSEVERLNPGRRLEEGQRYKIRRSNGDVEDGWELGFSYGDKGPFVMRKEDGLRREVSAVKIAQEHPHLVRSPKTGPGGTGELPEEVFGSNPPADSPAGDKATDRTPPASDRQQPERIAQDESRQGHPSADQPAPATSKTRAVKLEFEEDNNILPVGRQQLKDSPFDSQLDDQHVFLTQRKDGTLRVRGNSKQETYRFDASTGETTPLYLNDVKNFNKGDKIHLGAKDGPTIEIGDDGHPYLRDGTGTGTVREVSPQVKPGTSVPDVDLQVGKFKGRIAPGKEIDLGRYDLDKPEWHMEVSRKHMRVGRDETGNLYVVDNNKPTRTLIERGKNQFIELKPGERTVLEPGDVLRMGDKDGPAISIVADGPSTRRTFSDAPPARGRVEQTLPQELPARTGREHLNPDQNARLDKLAGRSDAPPAGHKLDEVFPPRTEAEVGVLRAQLRDELRAEVPTIGPDGTSTNVYDKIMSCKELGTGEKNRIISMLAEVRDAYKRLDGQLPDGHPAKGYQDVNWKHTRAEIDQVLEAALKNKLPHDEIENAILASIFSDAVKFPGRDGNFLVHNVDGARAAAEVLPRYFHADIPESMRRIEYIYRAIREHQIGPPEFMANFTKMSLTGKLGKGITPEQQALVDSITDKIKYPLEAPRVVDADGVATVDFSKEERKLLEQVGIKEWYVPNPDSPWYGASRAVIDGDSLINYATPDGWAKYGAIRGPGREPWFQDQYLLSFPRDPETLAALDPATGQPLKRDPETGKLMTVDGQPISSSLESVRDSFDDAYSVMTPEGQALANKGLARTEAAEARVKESIEEWFKTDEARAAGLTPNADGTIPFWNAPLKYPPRSGPPKFEMQLDQLSDVERKQFEFAMKLRDRVVQELRDQQAVFMAGDEVTPYPW